MNSTRLRIGLGTALAALALSLGSAQAQKTIKIGVLSDMTAVTADIAGEGSVAAAKMAIDDMAPDMSDWKVEMRSGDFQYKTDLAATIAAQWMDQDGVNVIVDVPSSAAALAIQELNRTRNVVVFYTGGSTPRLIRDACSPHGVQWLYDQYSNPNALIQGLKSLDFKTWYFLTGDATGQIATEDNMRALIEKAGLEIVGGIKAPMNTTDFSSYILQAASSNADAVVATFGGAPNIRVAQAARDFGLKSQVVAPAMFVNDVKAMGLETGQGIIFTDAFYWDLTDETRAWSKRFFDVTGKMPSSLHAAVYTQTLHYLKAVKAAGTTDADKVMEQVRAIPIDDFMTKGAHVELNGQVIRDRHIWRIKKPEDSTGEWDLQEHVLTVPGKDASFTPQESGCPLVK